MTEKKYAFVADKKVFSMFSVDSSSAAAGKWDAAFSSDPIGVDITNFFNVNLGWIWGGSSFTSPDNASIENAQESTGSETTRRYAFVVENEVFEIIVVQESQPMFERYKNGFSSPHVGMDVTEYENVTIGSIWDGTTFSLPVE